jgi:hypothetical protein
MDVPTCRFDDTEMYLEFYHGLVPPPLVVVSVQLAADAFEPLVAIASAHR